MAEQPTSTLAVYSPRPTIRVDAQWYPKVEELLLSMEVLEREGGLSSLELVVSNVASDDRGGAAAAFEDETILRLGSRLAVYGGDELEPREIFRGTVTALEADYPSDGDPTLTVLAEDVLQKARMERRTKLHEDASIADLASALASRLGLTPVVHGLADSLGAQVQKNESDLAFLRRLLDRHDADVQVVGAELHVSPRSDVARGTLELRVNHELRGVRLLADLAHQVTEVTVGGWDVAQGQPVRATSTGANAGPGSGRTGAALLRDAVGARSRHIAHLGVGSDGEARAVADAAFDSLARGFVTADGTAEGNAALRVGTQVRLTGLGSRFDNTYYVTMARHRFDLERGYETDFTAVCAYLGSPGT